MGKLVVSAFMTLDGVVQAPGGPGEDPDGGFEHEGWSVPFADEQLGRIMAEQFAGMEALLLGRRTYEIFASYWPRVTDPADPIASRLNAMPKYVASRTLREVTWHGSQLLGGNVPDAVADLKRRLAGELNVQGSRGLIATLQDYDLVDEYRLFIEPVVLGTGKRLFAAGTLPTSLRLTGTSVGGKGAIYCTYETAGRPDYGTFALDENAQEVAEEVTGTPRTSQP